MNQRVLCIITDGFEEIETITPVDVLRRAGADVVVASIGSFHVTGRSGITIHADGTLSDAVEQEYDLLLIPGGPGVTALRADGQAAKLARQFHDAGKYVAAICAAPTVLHDAGLLAGRRFTAHSAVQGELPDALTNDRVVVDDRIITSRGAGTALEFSLALVANLCGDAKAEEIALSILA